MAVAKKMGLIHDAIIEAMHDLYRSSSPRKVLRRRKDAHQVCCYVRRRLHSPGLSDKRILKGLKRAATRPWKCVPRLEVQHARN